MNKTTDLREFLSKIQRELEAVEEILLEGKDCDCPPEWQRCSGCQIQNKVGRMIRAIDGAILQPDATAKTYEEVVRERDAALAELERVKRDSLAAIGTHIAAAGDIGFKDGASAMREAAARLFEGSPGIPGLATMPPWAAEIRSLPTPERKT